MQLRLCLFVCVRVCVQLVPLIGPVSGLIFFLSFIFQVRKERRGARDHKDYKDLRELLVSPVTKERKDQADLVEFQGFPDSPGQKEIMDPKGQQVNGQKLFDIKYLAYLGHITKFVAQTVNVHSLCLEMGDGRILNTILAKRMNV